MVFLYWSFVLIIESNGIRQDKVEAERVERERIQDNKKAPSP